MLTAGMLKDEPAVSKEELKILVARTVVGNIKTLNNMTSADSRETRQIVRRFFYSQSSEDAIAEQNKQVAAGDPLHMGFTKAEPADLHINLDEAKLTQKTISPHMFLYLKIRVEEVRGHGQPAA
jgi:hypothetical protein